MHVNNKQLLIPALLTATCLIGCGDGTNNATGGGSDKPLPKAGESYTTSVLVNDKTVAETVYTVYSVADDHGKLTDVPMSDAMQEAQRPHVLIKKTISEFGKVKKDGSIIDFSDGPKKRAPAMSQAKVENCYANIWAKLKVAKPEATRQELAFGIAQFGVSVNDLCGYAAASGMSLDEYVELFQTVSKYYPGKPNIEADMVRFFVVLNVEPKTFITALSRKGYTWENFISKLAANKGDGNQFINGFASSGATLEEYIIDYMSRPSPAVAAVKRELKLASAYLTKDISPGLLARKSPNLVFAAADAGLVPNVKDTVDGYIDTANKAIETVDKGLAVGLKVWEFLRKNVAVVKQDGVDGKGGAEVSTSILSANDTASINYGYAKASSSPVISFVGKTLWWENYRVDLMLDADYDAQNASAPGQWLPNINVKLKKVQADYGYTLNGSAKVSNTVNRGAPDAPIPEAQIEVTLTASNWSVNQQSFTFVANGATGASVK